MTAFGGRWGNNVYCIQPISGLGIFADRKHRESGADASTPMSTKRDTGKGPMSGSPESRGVDTNKSQFLNQTHTPDVVCAEVGTDEVAQEAKVLVRRFHAARGHSKSRQPSSRECAQAQSLIASHGFDSADYILAFALKRAESTRFEMETFGAVLQYVDGAIEAKRKSTSRRRQLALPKRRDSYEDWQRAEFARIRSSRDPSELREIEEVVRAELLDELGHAEAVGFDLLLMARVNQLLAAQHDLSRSEFLRRRATSHADSRRRDAS